MYRLHTRHLQGVAAMHIGQQSQEGSEEEVFAARVEGASQDPTPELLIVGHPAATAALSPAPAAARSAALAAI